MIKTHSIVGLGIAMALAFPIFGACNDSGQKSDQVTANLGGSSAGGVSAGGAAGLPTGTAGGGSSLGGSSLGGAPAATVDAAIAISGANPRPVSPLFFGQNYWSWVVAWGDPVADIQVETKSLGLNLLRAGGAINDKQDPEPFSLSELDDYVAFAKDAGAEPLLQIPVLKNALGTQATPQDAAALVTYVNRTKAYGIRYFSIGNEPDLYEEQGLMPKGYTASMFCTTFTEFAKAMRAVDPSIVIMGPDLSWKYQSGANDWLTPFLTECGNVLDMVALHRYPLSPTGCTQVAAYADAVTFRQLITHVREIMAATNQANKPLTITEANITWDGDPAKSTMAASPGTFPAALWVADNLGVSLEEGLENVSYWSLSEGWTLGFLSSSGPRPAFHVLDQYIKRFGTEVLTVTGAPSDVSAYSGRDAAAEKTSLFIVNKTVNELAVTVSVTDLPRTDGATLTVPPLSLSVAEFADQGGPPQMTTYNANMTAPTTNH
jgi:hypothetical protein